VNRINSETGGEEEERENEIRKKKPSHLNTVKTSSWNPLVGVENVTPFNFERLLLTASGGTGRTITIE